MKQIKKKEYAMDPLIFYILLILVGVLLLCLSMLIHKKRIMPRLKEQVRVDGKNEEMRESTKAVKTASVVQNDPFDGIDTSPRGFFQKKK
ncbi:MAG: hypothetical protein J6J21_03435 [Clostridia bacterium]|nr:hypothetical protein [Clostridia bacterium]